VNFFAYFMLCVWLPVTLVACMFWNPRRVVLGSVLLGWLFLPMFRIQFVGFVDIDKIGVTSMAALLGMIVFLPHRLLAVRWCVWDFVMLVWCLAPMASSLSNNLGFYDGLSASYGNVVRWGLPYLLGRACFGQVEGRHELALAIVLGGLIYVPLCLYEMRMSPQLHNYVYGSHQHHFIQTKRMGGWRPVVFMQHGLAVSIWMATSTAMVIWLWLRGRRSVFSIRMGWAVLVLIALTLFCRSMGAMIIFVASIAVLLSCNYLRSLRPVLWMAAIPPLYMLLRVAFDWRVEGFINAVAAISEVHAGSLETRIRADALIVAQALERPIFGWGGWWRYNEAGVTPDTLWAITLGKYGFVGLLSLFGALAGIPAAAIWSKRRWSVDRVEAIPLVGLAVVAAMYANDALWNNMISVMCPLILGSLAAVSREPDPVLYPAGLDKPSVTAVVRR